MDPLALSASLAAVGLAAQWSNTITLGSVIVALLVGASTLIAVAYGARYKVGFEAASGAATELRKSLADETARSDRLERELREAREVIGEMKKTIARLENLPNVEAVVELMARTAEVGDQRAAERLERGIQRVNEIAADHEERAVARHESLLAVAAGMAANLERLNKKETS